MDIGPPIATATAPVAASFYPAKSQPTRPSTASSFGSSCGSVQERPSTARGSLASHRKLLTPTAEWSFLTKTVQESDPPIKKKSPLRRRPATGREKPFDISVVLPTRPVTARAKVRVHAPTDIGINYSTVRIEPVESGDARAIREAARHEMEQHEYVDPLHGKSVEPRNVEMAARSSLSITDAVSLHESLRVKAFQARAKGNYVHAIVQYSRLLEIAPNDRISRFQLAVAYEKTGSLQEALVAYESVISLDEGNAFAHYNIGNILMRMNRVDNAIQYYTRAIQKCHFGNKEHLVFYRQRGAAYRKAGDFEKASRDYAHFHSKCGHQVRQNDRPWETSTDDGSSIDVDMALHAADLVSDKGDALLATRIVYNSESLYAVPESSRSDKSETPFEARTHHRVFQIASSNERSRSDEDLLFVMDALQMAFPFCSGIRQEAAMLLGAKLVATENLRAGTPLFLESANGTHVFFICRGRVSAYKTVAQRIAQVDSSKRERTSEDDESSDPVQSWESLRAEMAQNASDEEVFPAAAHRLLPASSKWMKRQMQLCQLGVGNVIGFQGRHSSDPRTYSAIVTDECDVLALSWDHLLEIERVQCAVEQEQTTRFLRTVPVFHGIPPSELSTLALHAKRTKAVGSKAICSEGQFVDGIIVVREGACCQLSPSDLHLPPDLSIPFNLCGSFAVEPHEQEKKGLEFFTQLEYAGDPLAFFQLNKVVHGFLPHDFIERKVQQLQRMGKTKQIPQDDIKSAPGQQLPPTRKKTIVSGSARRPRAIAIHRGGSFFASSSWIPPRKSRQANENVLGVACAKSALISRSSADLLFFTSADLTASLSLASREMLHRNAQACTKEPSTKDRRSSFPMQPNARLHISTPLRTQGDDMFEQLETARTWNKFKDRLIQSILQDKKARKSRNIFQSRGRP